METKPITEDIEEEVSEDEIGQDWIIIEDWKKTNIDDFEESGEIEVYGHWYIVFKDSTTAGQAARDYFEDMARHDPDELRSIIGDANLIQWGLGNYASPGSTPVKSLEEWLDLWLDAPEEHWATYDGKEVKGRISAHAAEKLRIEVDPDDLETEVVLYRI
jgi:hypothetical protein